MNFTKALISWYLQNKRALPWRETRDPYRIWLSEIMLQQTRVAQAMPYYQAFTAAFADVREMAAADESQLLKLWQGLGYYSRARNMHHTARQVVAEYGGVFPDTYEKLQTLKGVGAYTAAAIASFAFDEAVAVVDGNVFRVLSRYFGVDTDIASSSARKIFTKIAQQHIPASDPATFNQAIMEFGALQCVPKNPDCGQCVLQTGCVAFQTGRVADLPVKKKARAAKERFLNYLVYQDDLGATQMVQRTGAGIWRNLYEFPMIETPDVADLSTISALVSQMQLPLPLLDITACHEHPVIHKLTHQKLSIRFWALRLDGTLNNGLDHAAALELPVPVVIHDFLVNGRLWKEH